MEGSLLRLKSFIPCGEKLPFEYGQISMLVYATSQKSPLDIATGTLRGILRLSERIHSSSPLSLEERALQPGCPSLSIGSV